MVTRLIFCEETAKLLQKSSMDVVTIQECSAMSSQSPNAADNQNYLEDRNKKNNHNPGLASIEDQYSIFESKRPQLLPHQLEGINFLLSNLANNTGCILADHMGLGKTAQGGVLSCLVQSCLVLLVLVLCCRVVMSCSSGLVLSCLVSLCCIVVSYYVVSWRVMFCLALYL
jgi:hypothetical protein